MQEPPIKSLVLELLSIESTTDRQALLDERCGADISLRNQVERFIACEDRLDDFLDVAAQGHAETVQYLQEVDPLIGADVGPYKLREKLGEGGMGTVYVAEQRQPVRRKVALKVVKQGMDTREVLARFEAERQALALMDHPNIAKVFDAGATDSGRPYFVMELIQGLPITDYCDKKKLNTHQRAELLVRVCQAIQHAHQKGVIHRDIKPSNVMVASIDGVAVPKVIDFGIAKATGQKLSEQTVYTNYSQLVGTPIYMSPEQIELGIIDIDTRSDVYSLGVLAYELFSSCLPFDHQPFRAGNLVEIQRVIREEEPLPPSCRVSTMKAEAGTTASALRGTDHRHLTQALRGELDWIMLKALEKDRSRRYQAASELAADLSRYLNNEAVLACPPTIWYRTTKFIRKNRSQVVTAALLAATLLVATGFSTRQYLIASQARDELQGLYKKEQLALEQKQAALEEADQERLAAEAINKFFVTNLLRAADPRQSDGKEVTLNDVLAKAEENIETGLGKFPRAQADARYSLGRTLVELGEIERAKAILIAAIEFYGQNPKKDDTNHRGAYTNLGRCEKAQGDLVQAKECWQKAFELAKESTDPDVPINHLINLALIEADQGNYAEALRLNQEIRDHYVASNRSDELPCVFARINMTTMLAARGDHEGILDESTQLQTQLVDKYGKLSPYTLVAMSNRAAAFDELGRSSEAVELKRKVIDLKVEVFGENSVQIEGDLRGLAIALAHLGHAQQAVAKAQLAVEIVRNHSPDNRDAILEAEIDLAFAKVEARQFEAAVVNLRRLDEQIASSMNSDDPTELLLSDRATVKVLLAQAHFQIGKDQAALQDLNWVIENLGGRIEDAFAHEDRVQYTDACRLKSQILLLGERHEEALRLLERTMTLKLTPVQKAELSWVRAQVLAAQGKTQAAWELIQELEEKAVRAGIRTLVERLRAYSLCATAVEQLNDQQRGDSRLDRDSILQRAKEIQRQEAADQGLNESYLDQQWKVDRILPQMTRTAA